MKKYLPKGIHFKSIFVLMTFIALVFNSGILAAENHIIITGQITNTQYGNPVAEHKVYIKSESVAFTSMFYYKILETDSEGFFYDTISAEKDYGSLEVFTYDHQGEMQSKTLHFRFFDITNNNTFLVNFALYMPYSIPSLQARFRFVKKVVGDKFRFKFVDETQNEQIRSWHWNFGDGTTSEEAYPEHIYNSFGMFKVSLTIEAIVKDHTEISTISRYVHIPMISFYNMGGHCFTNPMPIDAGQAFLYSVDKNNILTPFDTTYFDTLGYYYFYQVPEGNYCVKVQPDVKSVYYNQMIPTYYGNTSIWKEAKHIELTYNNTEYDVHLIESMGIEAGIGSIEGVVTFTNADKPENDLATEGIPVYLLDAYDNPMQCTYTNEEGHFDFGNIAMGTYWVYPEVTGYDSEKLQIILTQNQSEVTDLEAIVHADQAHLITSEDIENNDHFLGNPFPNPAADFINIEFFTKSSGEAQIDVIDMAGRLISTENLNLSHGMNVKQIQTSTLRRGIYFIRFSSKDFTKQRSFIINR